MKISKKRKIILIAIFLIMVFLSVGFLGIKKLRKSITFNDSFPMIGYTIKDYNFIKNYNEYKKISEEEDKKLEAYRNICGNKNNPTYIKTETAYFSDQGNHPDMVYFDKGKNGYKYWMAFTAYPFSFDKYENPHILVSNNGIDFKVPKNLVNPLVDTPKDHKEGGHLSDTDMIYSNGKFMIYYVYNKKGEDGHTKFYEIESSDGIKWTSPRIVYKTKEGYSPAIVEENNKYSMWYLEGENNLVKCTSKNGIDWSKSEKCHINMNKWLPWHVDIIKTDYGYEGLMCARNPELKTRALFYIRSKDGINFESSKNPILFPTKNKWDNREIYRSTLVKDGDKYRIWYSARGRFEKWHIGYTEYSKKEIQNLEMIK